MSRVGFTCALAWVLTLPAAGAAQSPWLGADRSPRIAAEVLRPGLDDQESMKALSSALYLSGRLRANESVAVVGEIPVAFGGFKDDADASAQVGNPYIGLELGGANRPFWVDLGGRLPVVGSDANSGVFVGMVADIDRMSAFASEMAVVSGGLNLALRDSSGLGLRLRAGPDFLIATGDNNESETLVYYGAQVSHVRGPLELSLHGSGVWSATESGSFGERSFHQVGVGASYDVGGARPGITFRLPVDKDLRDGLDYVIGISLQVPLR